ncbi:hypothetical protein ACFE04_020966 [Oxalis oulophora]
MGMGIGMGNGMDGGVVAKKVMMIPTEAKELVDSIREVVNHKRYTDVEIYDALLHCNMDPNDAVQNLLLQDTFQKVKTKRDKRKQVKGSEETKARVIKYAATRGIKAGESKTTRTNSTQANNFSESSKGKTGTGGITGRHSSTSTANYQVRRAIVNEPSTVSHTVRIDNRGKKVGWGMTTGHLSMADMVRNGSQTSSETDKPQETNQDKFSPIYSNDNEYPPVIEQQNDFSGSLMLETLSGDEAGLYRNNCFSDYHQPSQTCYVDQNSDNSWGHDYAALDLHQLNLGIEAVEPLSKDNSVLVFPSNVQDLAADCPLEFGTYKSGIAPSSVKLGLQYESAGSSTMSFDKNTLYRSNEQLATAREACNVTQRDVKNYDSQLEQLKQANSNANVRRENISKSSSAEVSNFKLSYEQRSTPTFTIVVDENATNMHPYVLQEMSKYPDGMPADLFYSVVRSVKSSDFDEPSSLLARQAMQSGSSMNSATRPTSEIPKYSMFSSDWQSSNPASRFAPRTALQTYQSAQANTQHSSSSRKEFINQFVNKQKSASGLAYAGMNNFPQNIGGDAAMSNLPYSNNANNAPGFGGYTAMSNLPYSYNANNAPGFGGDAAMSNLPYSNNAHNAPGFGGDAAMSNLPYSYNAKNAPPGFGGDAAMSNLPYSKNANNAPGFGNSASSAVDYADILNSQYNMLQQQNNTSDAWGSYKHGDSKAMPGSSVDRYSNYRLGNNGYEEQLDLQKLRKSGVPRGGYSPFPSSRDDDNNNNWSKSVGRNRW